MSDRKTVQAAARRLTINQDDEDALRVAVRHAARKGADKLCRFVLGKREVVILGMDEKHEEGIRVLLLRGANEVMRDRIIRSQRDQARSADAVVREYAQAYTNAEPGTFSDVPTDEAFEAARSLGIVTGPEQAERLSRLAADACGFLDSGIAERARVLRESHERMCAERDEVLEAMRQFFGETGTRDYLITDNSVSIECRYFRLNASFVEMRHAWAIVIEVPRAHFEMSMDINLPGLQREGRTLLDAFQCLAASVAERTVEGPVRALLASLSGPYQNVLEQADKRT